MKNKLRSMYERPEVSDAELEKFMDFDRLLVKRAALIRQRKIQYTVGGISAVAVISMVSWWMISTHEKWQEKPGEEIATQKETAVQEVFPVDSAQNEVLTFQEDQLDESSPVVVKKEPAVEPSVREKPKPAAAEPVYLQSAPTEGYANLYAYFERELIYPNEAIEDSIQGTVTVHCIIGKDGKPRDIEIENTLGELFDKEAIRVIENMPAWNPATLNGIPMDSKISIPLSFKLKSIRNED